MKYMNTEQIVYVNVQIQIWKTWKTLIAIVNKLHKVIHSNVSVKEILITLIVCVLDAQKNRRKMNYILATVNNWQTLKNHNVYLYHHVLVITIIKITSNVIVKLILIKMNLNVNVLSLLTSNSQQINLGVSVKMKRTGIHLYVNVIERKTREYMIKNVNLYVWKITIMLLLIIVSVK